MTRIALMVLLLLAMAGSAAARHRRSTEAVPGVFDYYVLSLSWSPAFCLSEPATAECSGPRRYGFIVHGLWPQDEQGWPENCNVHLPVPESTVAAMADIMPARSLVYHEWAAHGTCSGMDPQDFFGLVRRAYAGMTIPAAFASIGHEIEQSPGAVAQAFVRANPRLPAGSIVVTCSGQRTPRLREVHLCLNRDLSSRTCSAGVTRAACRAPTLIVPPIR